MSSRAAAIAAVLSLIAAGATSGAAQSGAPADRSPEALAMTVMRRFTSATPAEFAAVFPDSTIRAMVSAAAQQRATRVTRERRVLWRRGGRAVLFLAGHVDSVPPVAGEPRAGGRALRDFAGIYEAVRSDDRWMVTRQLPADSMNRIRAHATHVELVPGSHIDVVDTMSISVGAPYGFVAHYNNGTRFSDVRVDGRRARYAYERGGANILGQGMLWVDAPARAASQLIVRYSVVEERRPAPRAASDTTHAVPAVASGPPAYGEYFNTSGWHAYLDLNSANDRARFAVTVRAPAEYRLTTSLPQSDTVIGATRIVHGESGHPEFLVALLYDREWRPRRSRVGDLTVETFFRPDARASHDTVAAAFARVYHYLKSRFGPANDPQYLAVVESFGYGATSGCGQREADLVMCGGGVNDSSTRVLRANPTYTWAHETSHAWTLNADGPAATMLREGWATFAEGAAMGAEYPALGAAFWERARNGVMLGAEGRVSLIPPGPTGGAYSKGGWVLRMLEYVIGDSAFDRAIRAYSARQFAAKAAGYPELIADMSKEAGHDMTSFVMPWLSGKFMPDLEGQVVGTRLIVTQRQAEATYDLPKLDVDLVTAAGVVRRTVHVTKSVDTADVGSVGPVTGVKFDPDHHYLMQRRWGEVVRFELPVSAAPSATSVALGDRDASFSIKSIPATRDGDVWVVVLPLSEGRYPWRWELDGVPSRDPALAGVRTVTAAQLIGPYPR